MCHKCSRWHTAVGTVLPSLPGKVYVSRKLCHRQCVLREKPRDVQIPELSITCSQGPKPFAASTGAWLSRGCLVLLSTAVTLGTGWTLWSVSSANTGDDQVSLIQSCWHCHRKTKGIKGQLLNECLWTPLSSLFTNWGELPPRGL